MVSPRGIAVALLIALMLASCGTDSPTAPTYATGSVSPALPKATPSLPPDALGCLTIGDLPGFLDGLGSILQDADPRLSPEGLRALMGAQLGDPALKGISPRAGLALVVVAPSPVLGFFEVSNEYAPQFVKAVVARGQSAAYEDGLLLLADTEPLLDKARAIAGVVRRDLLQDNDSQTLQIAVSPQALLERVPAVRNLAVVMPALAMRALQRQGMRPDSEGTQSQLRLFAMQVRMLIGILRQTQSLEAAVSAPREGLRFDMRLSAAPGSDLAGLLNALPNEPRAEAAARLLPGRGALRVGVAYNRAALNMFLMEQAQKTIAAMNLPQEQALAIQRAWEASLTRGSGRWAAEAIAPETPDLYCAGYLKTADPADALADARRRVDDRARPLLVALRGILGAQGRVEVVDDSPTKGGLQVQSVRTTLDFARLAPDSAEMLRRAVGTMSLRMAPLEDAIAWTTGPPPQLDKIARAARKGKHSDAPPMVAADKLGGGALACFDLDVDSLTAFLAPLLSVRPAPGHSLPPRLRQSGERAAVVAGVLKDTAPMCGAMHTNDSAVCAALFIPRDLATQSLRAVQLLRLHSK